MIIFRPQDLSMYVGKRVQTPYAVGVLLNVGNKTCVVKIKGYKGDWTEEFKISEVNPIEG